MITTTPPRPIPEKKLKKAHMNTVAAHPSGFIDVASMIHAAPLDTLQAMAYGKPDQTRKCKF